MKQIITSTLAGILACVAAAPDARVTASDQPPGPTIHFEDVYRFYKIYDAAGGHPTADQLQREYLDPGSAGLHYLAEARDVTGERIAATLAKNPKIYEDARHCMDVLPRVRVRLDAALRELGRLYPQARFPPVTIAVSRGQPVGTAGRDSGVLIGLEALCAVEWLNPDVEDRFVYVIAHEFAHVQQASAQTDREHPTVLERSLAEGAAELMAELTAGGVGYSHLKASTKGREKEIETAFAADQDKTDLSDWIDNSTLDTPRDLGYWVGYRIVQAYYQHAPDKRQAVREILEMTEPKAFLAKSGWYPGIELK